MTTTTPLLRNVAVCIPLTVGIAGLFDVQVAIGATASGLLVLANLLALRWLVSGIVTAVAEQRSPVLLMSLAVAKFVLFTVLLLAISRAVPPMGLVLGFVPMVAGTLLTGIELALRESALPVDPELNEAER